jgi:hypothetical protein
VSDLYFPLSSLPGVVFAGRTPYFSDTVQTASAGNEYRINHFTGPRFRYEFEGEFLRSSLGEIDTLHGFFLAHGGRRDSFLLVDPVDGVTRRVRFDDPELPMTPCARGSAAVLACNFGLVSVVG